MSISIHIYTLIYLYSGYNPFFIVISDRWVWPLKLAVEQIHGQSIPVTVWWENFLWSIYLREVKSNADWPLSAVAQLFRETQSKKVSYNFQAVSERPPTLEILNV